MSDFSKYKTSIPIQCENFNWNEIHNLDIGDFCKKIPKQVNLFFLAHILAHVVFAYLLPEVRNHP
jgi:hypothetical protein